MKKIITTIVLCFCLLSCKDNRKDEVIKTVNAFYKTYQTTDNEKYLSKDLATLIEKEAVKEKQISEEIIQKGLSEDPYDSLQGDIFTSLQYGTCTSFKIGEVTMEANKAIVTIHFVNIDDSAGETFQSDDQIVLVNEMGWKIDNVIYGGDDNVLKNTKEVLLDFMNYKPE